MQQLGQTRCCKPTLLLHLLQVLQVGRGKVSLRGGTYEILHTGNDAACAVLDGLRILVRWRTVGNDRLVCMLMSPLGKGSNLTVIFSTLWIYCYCEYKVWFHLVIFFLIFKFHFDAVSAFTITTFCWALYCPRENFFFLNDIVTETISCHWYNDNIIPWLTFNY